MQTGLKDATQNTSCLQTVTKKAQNAKALKEPYSQLARAEQNLTLSLQPCRRGVTSQLG